MSTSCLQSTGGQRHDLLRICREAPMKRSRPHKTCVAKPAFLGPTRDRASGSKSACMRSLYSTISMCGRPTCSAKKAATTGPAFSAMRRSLPAVASTASSSTTSSCRDLSRRQPHPWRTSHLSACPECSARSSRSGKRSPAFVGEPEDSPYPREETVPCRSTLTTSPPLMPVEAWQAIRSHTHRSRHHLGHSLACHEQL
jgi:hypothetical protein